jgi:hypothetical protein
VSATPFSRRPVAHCIARPGAPEQLARLSPEMNARDLLAALAAE